MEPLNELAHLVARWVHLIAGIMWVGNSMLFNWLDRNLELPDSARKGLVGEIWMVHSGGFYQVEKKFLPPGEMPRTLHWFKWQNGITWLSGITLLVLVYYLGGAALMTDPGPGSVGPGRAVLIGVAAILGAWVAYDLIWRSPLGRRPILGFVLSLLVVAGLAAVLFRFLSGRAAYTHVGVMLGTLMTGNVWMVIIPSQRELVSATLAGREQDPKISYQAKQRSIHNNYMTFPLLFIMLSNHFPSTFGHAYNWLFLVVLTVGSALLRHLMNLRFTYRRWLLPATVTFFAGCSAAVLLFAYPQGWPKRVAAAAKPLPGAGLAWADVAPIVVERCQPCHGERPTHPAFPQPPNGVILDRRDQILKWKDRVKLRVVTLRNMPLANLTQMTDGERERLGQWIDQGARE